MIFKTIKPNYKTLIIMGVLLVAACVFPLFSTSNYLISVGVTIFTYTALGTAWNIISGYAGQSCWCMASFMAIGSYTTFILANDYGISPWISLVPGMLLSVLLSLIVGAICFKQRGMGFTLTTVAMAEIIRVVLVYFSDLTGGTSGLYMTYRENSLWKLTLKSNIGFFYIMLAICVISIVISYFVEKSRLGYYLRAIGADQDAAESLGINPYATKMMAFMISAALASAIGTFYACFLAYIDPNAISSLAISTKIGSMAIVGGLGHLFGPLIGAVILIPVQEIANSLLGSSGSGVLLYGLVLVGMIVLKPGGVISFFIKDENAAQKIWRKGKAHETHS